MQSPIHLDVIDTDGGKVLFTAADKAKALIELRKLAKARGIDVVRITEWYDMLIVQLFEIGAHLPASAG